MSRTASIRKSADHESSYKSTKWSLFSPPLVRRCAQAWTFIWWKILVSHSVLALKPSEAIWCLPICFFQSSWNEDSCPFLHTLNSQTHFVDPLCTPRHSSWIEASKSDSYHIETSAEVPRAFDSWNICAANCGMGDSWLLETSGRSSSTSADWFDISSVEL